MELLPEVVHARHLAELGFMKQYLDEAGYGSQIVEKSPLVPLHSMVVMLPGEEGRVLHLSFIPFSEDDLEHLQLLQLYTTAVQVGDTSFRRELEQLLPAVNAKLPIGHFGFKERDEVYYRYVYAVPGAAPLEEEPFVEIVSLFGFVLRMFGGLIEEVAEGRLDLKSALNGLDEAGSVN